MVQSFQNLSLHEDVINVGCRPNDLSFYRLDGNLLPSHTVLRQNYLAKTSFTKLLEHIVLSETATRVEVIALACI